MNELKKKLAEWAGFKFVDKSLPYMGVPGGVLENYWVFPDGTKWNLPNFPESLDACFKWLVPKAVEVHKSTALIALVKWMLETDRSALALCLAIEKLIEGGKT